VEIHLQDFFSPLVTVGFQVSTFVRVLDNLSMRDYDLSPTDDGPILTFPTQNSLLAEIEF
jgi:hypothetical protein